MSKTAKGILIARILEHIPLPYVPQIAQGVDDMLTMIEQEHSIDLRDFKGEIAAAREPWQRIHDQAIASGVVTDALGELPNTGD